MIKKILVIGGNGQLGNCFRKLAPDFEKEFEFNYEKTKKVDDSLEDTIKKLNEVFEKNVQKTIIQNDIVENKIISNDDFFECR